MIEIGYIDELCLRGLNKDFFVRKVFCEQQMLEKNDATYTFLQLKKQNINTFDAVNVIAEILQIDTR